MNTTDYFHGCFDEATIKTRFRELCKIHHPDLGGSHEAMIALRAAYEAKLRGEFRKSMDADETEATMDLERELADKVAIVVGLEGLIVELVGKWLWITGETYTHKDTLKREGFSWASKKRAWTFHRAVDACTSYGKKSLAEIRGKYGSAILRGGNGHARLT